MHSGYQTLEPTHAKAVERSVMFEEAENADYQADEEDGPYCSAGREQF